MPSPASNPDQYIDRMRAVYDAVVAHKAAHDGNCPTRRELGRALGLSTSMVHFYLKRLVLAGLREWDGASTRSFRVAGARWQPPIKSSPDVLKAVRQGTRVKQPALTRPRGSGRVLIADERAAILTRLLDGEDADRVALEYEISESTMYRLKRLLR